MKQYILFDLDGTLTDPKEGITKCVQYALAAYGIEEPDLDKLEPFIGPPLKDSFMSFYQMSEEQATEAVAKYRERFQDTGIFENKVYDGIPQMLRTLQSKGLFLAVASSKPTVYVERILEHFGIRKYFKVVVGSELDGRRVDKNEVIEEALRQLFGDAPVQREKVYMVGDRCFDVAGAKAAKVESVAVEYGYGSMEELKEAKADYIVRSVEELEKFLLRGVDEETEPKKGVTFQRIWIMLYAFLMFMLVRNVVMYGLNWVLLQIGQAMNSMSSDLVFLRDEAGTLIGFTGNATSVVNALGFIGGIIPSLSTAKLLIEKTAEETKLAHLKPEPAKNYFLLGLLIVGSVLGLNILFELIGLTEKSEAYQLVVQDQYAAAFGVGILCYGIITPVVEEILFRGIIYNYLKRMLKLKVALILSSVLFGLYHMNSVQGAYGFLMGCLIAYGYEYFGDFKVAVLIHVMSNALVYCLSYTPAATSGLMNWPACIIFLVLALFMLRALDKQKNVL